MLEADIIVLGAGIAGLSLAAELSSEANVLLLETESAPGFHASGRSATLAHFGVGTHPVRILTRLSRNFFCSPPEGFSDMSVASSAVALFVAREKDRRELDALAVTMSVFAPVREASLAEMARAVPVLRIGEDGIASGCWDPTALRIDVDCLLQAYLKRVRRNNGQVRFYSHVSRIRRQGLKWKVEGRDFACAAPVVVNATGAWGDEIARMAEIAPLGLAPMRRTIIVLDPPEGEVPADWPFVRTAVDEFVLLPQGGRLLASALDETPSEPCDAQPEELDIAIAAARVQEYTRMPVTRIARHWAGLRTFASDRTPVAGFARDAEGFFWLAGQGGYGIQTAPAMACAAAALILDRRWPGDLAEAGLGPEHFGPARFSSVHGISRNSVKATSDPFLGSGAAPPASSSEPRLSTRIGAA